MAVKERKQKRIALAALAFIAASGVARAEAPDYRPGVAEATLLPRFCWKQFMGNRFSAPQFDIPRDKCGVYVNHYCIGLIDLNRANRTFGNLKRKRALLRTARTNTLYTLRGIKDHPYCPIRSHVEATLRVVNDELKAFR